MKTPTWLRAIAAVLFALAGATASAQQIFDIACEGQESMGGGVTRYQYTLRNPTPVPQLLGQFCFGTEDPVIPHYTALTMPAGWAFLVVPNGGAPPCPIGFTSGVKTPHGALPPPIGGGPSAFQCVFVGPVIAVPPGGLITFGFDNPRCSWDVEWFAAGPGGGAQGFANQPIAGPLGVYTNGWIHAPGYRITGIGAPFCDASDNSLASCPCANPGFADTGCDIAQSTGGVGLEVLAQQTAPTNRATLFGWGYPTGALPGTVVIRAPSLDALTPVVFGDGLRCISTPLVRLGGVLAMNGCSFHVIGHGAMAGAGTFYYQIWLRNQPIMFCDPTAAYNLSNGRTLIW